MWLHELHPPHLTNVIILPCENKNTKNVMLQQDITKDNCSRCFIASSKRTTVILCLKFTYMGCYIAMHISYKDSWHRWPVKVLDANLVWLRPGHHRHCDWPVAWPSEIMCVCWWWTLWTYALTWMFTCMIHQNILWNCQCNLMHVTAIL